MTQSIESNKIVINLTETMNSYTHNRSTYEEENLYNEVFKEENIKSKKQFPFVVTVMPMTIGYGIHAYLFDNTENIELILDFSQYREYKIERIKIYSKKPIKSLSIRNASLCKTDVYKLANDNIQTTYVNCYSE